MRGFSISIDNQHFNPRSREGSDYYPEHYAGGEDIFQSTLP